MRPASQPAQRPFDLKRLSDRLDQARSDRSLTWTQISKEVSVATSTIRRFATADDAEADGVLALVGWLGVAPEEFVRDSKVAGEPLPAANDGVIRVDMGLVAALPRNMGRQRVGTRTTIQRLTTVAQESGMTIASLTRRSLS